MAKYLWDLTLENIPLGWIDIYEDYVRNCPHGEIYGVQYHNDEDVTRHYVNPVKCKEVMLKRFNQLKLDAVELIGQRDSIDLKEFMNQLIKIDIQLFSILDDWTTDFDEVSSLDPNKYTEKELSKHYSWYINSSRDLLPNDPMLKYDSLKLINLL